MTNDSIQTGGPPYPNFQWPYPKAPSTGIQLFNVGSDAPHWTGGHRLAGVAGWGQGVTGAGGNGSGIGRV